MGHFQKEVEDYTNYSNHKGKKNKLNGMRPVKNRTHTI